MRNLNFFEIIDSHRILVAFTGEKYFDKVCYYAKLLQFTRAVFRVHRQSLVGSALRLAPTDVIGPPDALGHLGERKMIEAAAHVAAGVAFLKAPGENQVQSGSRNNPELTELGYCPGKPPIGDTRTHASLNDHRIVGHNESPNFACSNNSAYKSLS